MMSRCLSQAVRTIVIICGPTAAGKTGAGIALAKRSRGEIVSADSQQVWRGFDIGTAKANLKDRTDVPHHLIDVADPEEHFDAARFVSLADAAIADIAVRGKIPFVVGGTGMYLRMLVSGLCEAPPGDPKLRAQIEKEIEANGTNAAHDRLREIDPASAARISPNDHTRIIRAIEIHELTGKPASEFRKRHRFEKRRYDALKIGLTLEREELYRRIDARVDRMIAAGLVEEVRGLLARHGASCQPFSAVGYREIVAHLRGEVELPEAIRLTKQMSRNFAKRQLTWFRADPEIRWCDPAAIGPMIGEIETFFRPIQLKSLRN